jgi:hypothetical protein
VRSWQLVRDWIGLHDGGDVEIYREDASGDDVRRLAGAGSDPMLIAREFRSARRPATWAVWPMGADGGWLDKIMGAPELCG